MTIRPQSFASILRKIALLTISLLFSTVNAEPSEVTVVPVGVLETFETGQTSAEVIARNRSVLSAEVAGKIAAIEFDVGENVQANDVLIRIDDASYRLAVKQAKARLGSVAAQIEQAKIQLKRIEKLILNSYASTDELLAATTNLKVLERSHEQAKADLALAQIELKRCQVRAAVDGVVEERRAQLGEYVLPGSPLLTLTQTSKRQVAASVYPGVARNLQQSQSLWFEAQGRRADVKLSSLSEVISPSTRVQAVRMQFVEENFPIGTLGELKWTEADGRIPSTYLSLRNNKLGVFLAEGDTAVFHPLPDALAGRNAQHSLTSDTLIIDGGRLRLQHNDKIIVVSE